MSDEVRPKKPDSLSLYRAIGRREDGCDWKVQPIPPVPWWQELMHYLVRATRHLWVVQSLDSFLRGSCCKAHAQQAKENLPDGGWVMLLPLMEDDIWRRWCIRQFEGRKAVLAETKKNMEGFADALGATKKAKGGGDER